MALPEEGKFKIQAIGKTREGTSKAGNKYRIIDLQFEGDGQWYDTFWKGKEDPYVSMELEGTKSYDEKFNSYKFDMKGGAGKANWNPAAAQAAVIGATVEAVNGFLSLGNHYELWDKNDASLKPKFDKYLATIASASNRIKDQVVGMGGLNKEAPAGGEAKPQTQNDGDPGPASPPDVQSFPDDGDDGDIPI